MTKRGLMMCGRSGHQTSVTAGTIFHRSHLPLRAWFRAMWGGTNQKHGVRALGVQRLLGLGSYETAWACLQKVRRAMMRPGRDRRSGDVEVEETYVGGLQASGGRRSLANKALVAAAAQIDGKGIGRIRLRRIPDASSRSLQAFITETIEPGSRVITDGWAGYEGLAPLRYKHKSKEIRGSGKTASTLLPRVHRVASWLKRWLLGTHQGGVSRNQVDYYLDEFTFRFTRRTSRYRDKLCYRLGQQAVAVPPAPFSKLVVRPNHDA